MNAEEDEYSLQATVGNTTMGATSTEGLAKTACRKDTADCSRKLQ